jgi:CubicO group peptidase (beta-lactamase class C family)
MALYHGGPSRLPISPDTFKKACVRVNDSEWSCGFNHPSRTESSSGRFFSPASIGHLGFTGVSFWIDVINRLIVCLLTNRVIKGDNREGIRKMRPHLHDTVVTCLQEAPRNP